MNIAEKINEKVWLFLFIAAAVTIIYTLIKYDIVILFQQYPISLIVLVLPIIIIAFIVDYTKTIISHEKVIV
jgi:hypothetical protein